MDTTAQPLLAILLPVLLQGALAAPVVLVCAWCLWMIPWSDAELDEAASALHALHRARATAVSHLQVIGWTRRASAALTAPLNRDEGSLHDGIRIGVHRAARHGPRGEVASAANRGLRPPHAGTPLRQPVVLSGLR